MPETNTDGGPVVWLLYYREWVFGGLIVDRLFGVFSSLEAVVKHMEWRKEKDYGTGPGFFVNPSTLDAPHLSGGHTKDVIFENGQFTLVNQAVAVELAKERGC
jgi:hypothetical protein